MRFRAFVGPRECVTLDVPGSPERPPFALEATFDRVQGMTNGTCKCSKRRGTSPRWCSKSSGSPSALAGLGCAARRCTLVGSSDPIRELRDRISRVAATDFTVVEGESGSGKELVARQLHEQSRRRRGSVRRS